MRNKYSSAQLFLLCQFGTRLRSLRLKQGLTQEKLAELAEINKNYLSDVERGERNISLLNLIAISKGLKIQLKELLSD